LQNKKAFTIIEIVVSIMVFSVFIMAVMYLYSRSSDSFRITAWKQERAAQSDIFWAQARKALEEATNRLEFSTDILNPTLTESPRPVKIHPDPSSAPNGNILAWNVSRTIYDMASSNHTSEHSIYSIARQNRRLVINGGGGRAPVLDDVVAIEFIVSSVIKTANNAEEIVAGINADAIGTLLEISLTLAPPDGYIARDLKVPMSHKFRLNVAPFSDSAPTY
jgi:prepilin-type N-terminal cleavage/methylation domain-containing protein